MKDFVELRILSFVRRNKAGDFSAIVQTFALKKCGRKVKVLEQTGNFKTEGEAVNAGHKFLSNAKEILAFKGFNSVRMQ